MGKLIRKKKVKRKTQFGCLLQHKDKVQPNLNRNGCTYEFVDGLTFDAQNISKVEFGEFPHPLPDICDSTLQAGRPMTYRDFEILSSSPRAMKNGIERTFNTGVHSEDTEHLSTLKRLREDPDAFIKEVAFPGVVERIKTSINEILADRCSNGITGPITMMEELDGTNKRSFEKDGIDIIDCSSFVKTTPDTTREIINQIRSKEKPEIVIVGSCGYGESIAQIFRDEIPSTILVYEAAVEELEKYRPIDMIDPIITELPGTINIDKRVIKKKPFKRIIDRKSQRIKSKMLK